MADLRLDNFSGGQSDHYVDGLANTARRLRNVYLDSRGKPYTRPGSRLLTAVPNASEIVGSHIRGTTLYTSTAGELYHGTLSQDVYGKMIQVQLSALTRDGSLGGTLPAFASDNDHTIITGLSTVALKAFGSAVVAAGLPTPRATITVTAGPGTAYNYIYYVVLKRSYSIGGKSFVDLSIPYATTVQTGSPIGGGSTVSISLDYAANTWCTAKYGGTVFQVYRTLNAGTVPYLATSGNSSGLNPVTDLTTDAQLQEFEVAYFAGGAARTGAAPRASYAALINNIGWYANSSQSSHYTFSGNPLTQTYGANIAHQSVPGDIDGVPESAFMEFGDEVAGIAGVDVHPIVFERKNVWRIEGQFGQDGSGSPIKRRIADNIGCISHRGIVNIGGALVFPGEDQLYVTDGFTTKPFTPHLKESYKRFFSNIYYAQKCQGSFSTRDRRVIMSFGGLPSAKAESLDTTLTTLPNVPPQGALVIDIDKSNQVASVTEIDGEQSDTLTYDGASGVKAYARLGFSSVVTGIDGRLIRSDLTGNMFVHEEDLVTDYLVSGDPASFSMVPYGDGGLPRFTPPASWITAPIVSEVISGSWSFGTEKSAKWFTKLESSLAVVPIVRSDGHFKVICRSSNPTKLEIPLVGLGGMSPIGLYVSVSADGFNKMRRISAVTGAAQQILTADVGGLAKDVSYDYMIFKTPGYVSADMWAARDNTDDFRALKVIRHRNINDLKPLRISDRYFPRKTLRAFWQQLRIKSAYQVLLNSDNTQLATISGAAAGYRAVTKSSSWPSTVRGAWLHFATDGYVTAWRIMHVSGTTIHIMIPSGATPPSGTSQAWEVRGYAQDETLHLEGLTMTYQELGSSMAGFSATEQGSNVS